MLEEIGTYFSLFRRPPKLGAGNEKYGKFLFKRWREPQMLGGREGGAGTSVPGGWELTAGIHPRPLASSWVGCVLTDKDVKATLGLGSCRAVFLGLWNVPWDRRDCVLSPVGCVPGFGDRSE